jgi:DNA replication protein DnaC
MMERSEILATMGELKLYGMRAAFDQIVTTAVKRQHEPQQVIGDLVAAETAEKQARSIKYQMTLAKLPLAKDVEEFSFGDTPVNEALVRDLAGGDFLAHQRNVVLVGGTGTGKTHVSTAAPDPRPRGKNVGTPCCWPGEVIAARVRHRRAGAGPSLASLPGSGAAGVIQQ